MTLVEDTHTGNLHQDFVQPLSTQRSDEVLASVLKESQTSNKSFRWHTSTPASSHLNLLQNCQSFKIAKFCKPRLPAGTYIWNIGKVIFLRKPQNEDCTIANSYRPIKLTSYVGKLFERTYNRETIEK